MPYATIAELEARIGAEELLALTDRERTGLVGEPVAQRALDDADAEIDAYLAGRYALPLSAVPAVLARVACDIARYRLWAAEASDEVRTRYEDAVRLLARMADGSVVLPVQPPAAGASVGAAVAAPPARVFPPHGY